MQTPGAAIVWLWSAASVAKLLKSAEVSSTSVRHVFAAPPPGWPVKSATAGVVRPSPYAAGRPAGDPRARRDPVPHQGSRVFAGHRLEDELVGLLVVEE